MTITGQPSFARWQQSRDITPWTVVHGSTINELIATIHTNLQPIIDAFEGLVKAAADIIDGFNAVFGPLPNLPAPQTGFPVLTAGQAKRLKESEAEEAFARERERATP